MELGTHAYDAVVNKWALRANWNGSDEATKLCEVCRGTGVKDAGLRFAGDVDERDVPYATPTEKCSGCDGKGRVALGAPNEDVTWSGPLGDAREHVTQALQKLLDCPEVFRPFVVIEEANPDGSPSCFDGRFVQFAGLTERGLLFDVPALGILAEPCPTPIAGTLLAITNLTAQGVPTAAVVRVTFESTRDAPMRFKRPAQA